MKKLLAVLSTMVMLGSAVSCGETASTDAPASSSNNETSAPAENNNDD